MFGPLLDEFLQWMHEVQHYSVDTVSVYLNQFPRILRWLRRRQIKSIDQLTLQHLKAAHGYFLPRHVAASGAVRVLERFLRAKGTTTEGEAPTPSRVESEIDSFATYLREMRGFSQRTIRNHRQQLRGFLKFLQFDRHPSRLRQLQPQPAN